jgi:hypothetical protein
MEVFMHARRLVFLPVIVIILSLLLSVPVKAAEETSKKEQANYYVSFGVEYSTGKYGTNTTTNAVAVPMKLGWYPTDRLDLSLEIPYLYQSNSVTTPFGMGRFRTARMQQSGPGQAQRPMRVGPSQFATTFNVTQSQSGIGDLILKGGYIVVQEEKLVPEIRPEAYVKIPTADQNKGLGTGKFDGGVGVTLTKWVGNWNGYIEGVYNFIGKSQNFNLRNFFSYEAGVGYQVTDRFLPAIALKGATNPGEDSVPPFEMRIKALYNITGRLGVDGYLSKGFTDGTADFGTGAEISYEF